MPTELIFREEVTATLFAIADISVLEQRLAADRTTKEDVMKRLRDAQSEWST